MRRLRTTNGVVKALGGIDELMRLTGANSKQIWNWTGRFGRFPAKTYVCLTRALNRRGYTAPARLWSMTGINDEEEAA